MTSSSSFEGGKVSPERSERELTFRRGGGEIKFLLCSPALGVHMRGNVFCKEERVQNVGSKYVYFYVYFDVLICFFLLLLFAVSVSLGVRLGGLVDSGGKR